MAKPRRFNLLLVGSDGARIFRLTLPRWVMAVTLAGATAGLLLVATSFVAIYGDYCSLREQRAALSLLLPQVNEQQALLEAYQARARELRAEISAWRGIHARILQPFGPDAGPAKRTSGIGGGTAPNPLDSHADRVGVKEELARVAGLVREEGENLRALELFLSRAGQVIASLPSRWPIRGTVNSEFGRRVSPWAKGSEFHSGIDIGAAVGTPVNAPAPGTVVFAGRHPEYGVTLIIDHGNDTKSLYGHLSKLNVGADQPVGRGDVVALTGNTGRSSGPHLHYEIQVRGQSVNPNTYLWE